MNPNEQLIRNVEGLLQRVLVEYNNQKTLRPQNDIRSAFLGLPGNILHSLLLQLVAANDTIMWPQWWQNRFGKQELLPIDLEAIDQSAKLMKHSYLVFFFARIETLQRKSINIISPGFDPGSTKTFKQVYDRFLATLNLQKFIPLFDIARHIRNSVHTNGIHVPHSGNNAMIEWQGRTFEFIHLQQIQVLTIENFLFLLDELLTVLIEIVNAPAFSSIPFVEDKFN